VIVDDHPLLRQAIRQIVEAQPDIIVCGEADDRKEALDIVIAQSPDLAIVDLSLKTSSGMDLVKDIQELHSGVASLVLSMHNDSLHALRSVRAGASGYICKQEPPGELVKAIRKVLAGDIYWPEKVAMETVNRLANKRFVSVGEMEKRLSERELQVFELIGGGSTPAQIAAIMDVQVTTVDTYQSRIKEKLSLKDAKALRHEAIRWNLAKNGR
jgi:DNA-binding NarL/FixJ family response regulator